MGFFFAGTLLGLLDRKTKRKTCFSDLLFGGASLEGDTPVSSLFYIASMKLGLGRTKIEPLAGCFGRQSPGRCGSAPLFAIDD